MVQISPHLPMKGNIMNNLEMVGEKELYIA